MFSRRILISGLLFSYISSIITSNDEATSNWVQQTYKNETEQEEEELDLTPSDKVSEQDDLDCVTDKGQRGYCVVYYLCDPDSQTIIADGTTLIDTRNQQCLNYLDICCVHKNVLSETSVTTTKKPTANPLFIYDESFNSTKNQQTTSPPTGHHNSNSVRPSEDWSSQCGWDVLNIFIFPKKKTAIYANFGEFPWAVAVIRKRNTTSWSPNDYIGGGTLIHPSAVLTVAHKVDKLNASMIKIRAGEWDTQTVKEKYQYQERNVKKIIIHPHFFKTSLYFDVALLIMASPFDLANAPHIKPACLGASLPPPGTECFSMGWGKDFNDDYKDVAILKKIQLPLVGSDECTEKLQKSRLGPYFRIHTSLTCAGGVEGIDTCEGDGGSALVCPIETRDNHTRYVAYGLVAYGIDCGLADRPGVYANIPTALQWIDQEMTKEKLGTATYNL